MAESSSLAAHAQKLTNKVAIVTGGASGIGEATARAFADHGARMVVIADIQDQLGQAVAKSIGTNKCSYVHCDVTNEDQVKSTVDWTVQSFGKLDIMFSNAGVVANSDQTVLNLDFEAFDRLFAVNVRGMAVCVKYAARAMVDGGVRGSVVCTASVGGSKGGKKWTDYIMSKHAVVGLVRSASLQLGVYGIRVNCVSPSGVVTPMTLGAYDKRADEIQSLYEANMSLKGVVVKAEDVAEAVVFLACDESQVVTGHDLVVDGGFVSR